jgi:4-hydroxy-4-methyl-2-oxoglutarate aldolase
MGNQSVYKLAERYRRFLRVTDVTDALDAVGLPNLTLMSSQIRPLWMGMHFWGPAVTMRALPTNRTMPSPLEKKDAIRQHAIWREMNGWRADVKSNVKQGCVIVTSTGGAGECGYWGSMNSMEMQAEGVAGIVTEGTCRDTDEVILQRTPVACGGIGRPIIPGRLELEEVNSTVSCGGVMVRPGDIVGCDWDGVVVVPQDVAEDVLVFAARIAVDDKRSRRKLYDRLGREPDETVDFEAAENYFKDLL